MNSDNPKDFVRKGVTKNPEPPYYGPDRVTPTHGTGYKSIDLSTPNQNDSFSKFYTLISDFDIRYKR